MNGRLPPQLADLLNANDSSTREAAWAGFVDEYSRLILHSVRSIEGEYDVTMDRYAHVLEQLRSDDFQRLRTFGGGEKQFSTWLAVVSRRLSIDHHRKRYGRVRETGDEQSAEIKRIERRALADLLTEHEDIANLDVGTRANPEQDVRTRELGQALDDVLETIDARDRLLLAWRFEDGKTGREIARLMGFATPFHAYRRINKVLAALRGELEKRGFEDSRS